MTAFIDPNDRPVSLKGESDLDRPLLGGRSLRYSANLTATV